MKPPPDNCNTCFRGVRNATSYFGEGTDISVFSASDAPVTGDWLGTSVNWDLDDGGALDELIQRKDRKGNPQFKGGAVKLPRSGINSIVKKFGSDNFNYEWAEEDGNVYHGHLLFSGQLIKERRSAIYGALSYISIQA